MSAPEEYFPLRLNLEQFFNDERQRVLLSAIGLKPVRWLLRKLRRVVPLPPRSQLAVLVDGYLLPQDEPLEMLRNACSVEIVPVSVKVDQISAATVQVTTDIADSDNDEIDAPSIPVLELTPIKPKQHLPQPVTTVQELSSSEASLLAAECIEDPLESHKQQALLLLQQFSTETSTTELEPTEASTEILFFADRPRKRRRVRRRKRVAPLAGLTSEEVTNPVEKLPKAPISDDLTSLCALSETTSEPKDIQNDSNESQTDIVQSWGLLDSLGAPQIVRCATVRAPRLVHAISGMSLVAPPTQLAFQCNRSSLCSN